MLDDDWLSKQEHPFFLPNSFNVPIVERLMPMVAFAANRSDKMICYGLGKYNKCKKGEEKIQGVDHAHTFTSPMWRAHIPVRAAGQGTGPCQGTGKGTTHRVHRVSLCPSVIRRSTTAHHSRDTARMEPGGGGGRSAEEC